jgi:hypothetical protein
LTAPELGETRQELKANSHKLTANSQKPNYFAGVAAVLLTGVAAGLAVLAALLVLFLVVFLVALVAVLLVLAGVPAA